MGASKEELLLKYTQRELEMYDEWTKVIQWGRKNPVKFVEEIFGMEFMDYQKYIFMSMWTTPYVCLCQCRNSGKALALDTPINTPDGWKTMGELQVGDYVYGDDGKPTKIVTTSPIFIGHQCFEVTLSDGEKIIADADHLWEVKVRGKMRVMNTKDMSQNYYRLRPNDGYKEYRYQVKTTEPIDYGRNDKLPIHPYVLGVWLGDGNSHNTRVTSHIDDTEEMRKHIENCGYKTSVRYPREDISMIGVYKGEDWGKFNQFRNELKNLNLLKNKHIPEMYLKASIEDRYELLRGLMDTDGYCSKFGECEFCQKDLKFIEQFEELLNSLGIKNSRTKKKIDCEGTICEAYYVRFFVDKEHTCFKLKRKHDRVKEKVRMNNYKSIISIKEVKSVPTKCIMVDNESHLYLCGKKNTVTHNSFLYAPYIMARSMLIPNFQSYIISSNGDQAKETFMKIENIAKKQIASLRGLTDVFANELITNNANRDGFKHGASSFEFTLFNGSTCNTLTSNYDGSRGKRSNCNIYDETGFMSQKAFGATEPFTTQDADFSTGGGIDVSLLPKKLQNQIIYASSASAVDTYFYSKYKEYGKQMMMGNKNFFVVDIPCDIPINPFKDGKLYPVGVLSQSKVDKAMREDKATAIREYKNIFDKDGGENQPFKMGTIQRNSKSRKPSLYNEDNGKHHYGFFYDPAHEYDNSIMLIADFYETERYGWMCDIINMVSFADIGKKNKTPMRYPDQLRMIKDLITSYNGKGYADYENIGKILVDAGSGGGGNAIFDPLLTPWTDSKGNTVKGLIDIENSEDAWRYPNAVDKLMLVSPKKYKTAMFDALKDMMDKDLITFPNKYEGQGYIRVEAKTGKKVNNGKEDEVELKKISLDFDEELALRQLDLMKSEICAFWRYDNADHTAHKYKLQEGKENTMHDDRAYTLAMCGWYLSQLRSSEKKKINPNSGFDPKSMIRFRKPKVK